MSHKAVVARQTQVKGIWKYKGKGPGQFYKRLILISRVFYAGLSCGSVCSSVFA